MARPSLALRLLLLLALASPVWCDDLVGTPSRPVGPAEMERLRSYGKQLGESLLRESLGLGLEDFELEWDPISDSFRSRRELRLREAALAGWVAEEGEGGGRGVGSKLRVGLVQTDTLGRLSRGLKSVPFGLALNNFLPLGLTSLETRLLVPLTGRGEWKAGASLPLQLFRPGEASLWRSLGLGQRLSLRSQLQARAGWQTLETGIGTDLNAGLLGPWNLDYAWRVRYGLGERESVQWLKLSKEF